MTTIVLDTPPKGKKPSIAKQDLQAKVKLIFREESEGLYLENITPTNYTLKPPWETKTTAETKPKPPVIHNRSNSTPSNMEQQKSAKEQAMQISSDQPQLES